MKLSIEARVAAAVGVAFAALSVCAIAQEQGERGPNRPNAYGTNSPRVSQTSLPGFESSLTSPHRGTGENQLLARH